MPTVDAHAVTKRDYMRNRRHKAKPYLATWAAARPGYKVCRACEKELPREKFAPRKAGKDGRASHCCDCVNARKRASRAANLESVRAKEREWDRRSGRHTLRSYGVGREQWDAQVAKQGGRCAACGRLPRRRLVGDHCHETGKFRGIVCDNCNISMGLTGDDPVLLRRLADWIEQGGSRESYVCHMTVR